MIKFLISEQNGLDSVGYRFIDEPDKESAERRASRLVQSIIVTTGTIAVDYVKVLDVIQYDGNIKSTPLFIDEGNHIIIYDMGANGAEYT